MEEKNGSSPLLWIYVGAVLGVLGYIYWKAQREFESDTRRRLFMLENLIQNAEVVKVVVDPAETKLDPDHPIVKAAAHA